MVRRFILVCCTTAVLFVITGQTNKDVEPSKPPKLSQHLDSLRKADNLTEWLYSFSEYVDTDPVNLIASLAEAQSTAWRKCNTDEERLAWFSCLARQGYYFMYGGDILHSINAYEEAYRFYFDKTIPGANVLEYVLKPLGNNYTRLGDYDRALFIQEKSLALAKQQDSSQVASSYHNLATTVIWKDDLPLAQQYCENGLKSVEQHSALHGLLLSTLSEIFFRSKKMAAAEDNIGEAIKILEKHLADKENSNAPYWLCGAYQVKADIEKEKNERATALQYYNKAIAIIDHYYKGQRKREKAKLFVLSGHVLLQLKQPQQAIGQYNAALSLLIPSFQPHAINDLPVSNELYGENTLLDALHGKADCLQAINKKDDALQCYMLMYVVERKLRHEFFSSAAKEQQQKENRQWEESAIATAYELWRTTNEKEYANNILLIAEMSKAQLLLDEMMSNLQYNRLKTGDTLLAKQQQLLQAIAYYEKETAVNGEDHKTNSNATTAKRELQYQLSLVQKEVKEKYPSISGYITGEQMPSVNSLLHSIPVNTTVTEFFAGQKNVYIIEAVKGGIQQVRICDSATRLQQVIKDFTNDYFQQGPQKMMNDPQGYCRDAYNIYHQLWPMDIEKRERGIIIPDGIFGYLPFDALVTDSIYRATVSDWPFLLRKTNLYLSYSLQTWQQQQKNEHPNRSFAGFFVSFDSSTNASLPAVKKEEDAIANSVQGDFFSEQNASLAVFNDQLSKVNLLHISTHSFLQGKTNMPVLQLADNKFFLFELYGKAFQPQLVVLSACRTGHGILAEGEGIISLARGFTATGAGGIVAGLWNMNDEATAKLIGVFYQQLVKDHYPADALYVAKLQSLQQTGSSETLKLPYFWAGMIYSGDNQPVFIEKKKSGYLLWWIATVIILIFFGGIKKWFTK